MHEEVKKEEPNFIPKYIIDYFYSIGVGIEKIRKEELLVEAWFLFDKKSGISLDIIIDEKMFGAIAPLLSMKNFGEYFVTKLYKEMIYEKRKSNRFKAKLVKKRFEQNL